MATSKPAGWMAHRVWKRALLGVVNWPILLFCPLQDDDVTEGSHEEEWAAGPVELIKPDNQLELTEQVSFIFLVKTLLSFFCPSCLHQKHMRSFIAGSRGVNLYMYLLKYFTWITRGRAKLYRDVSAPPQLIPGDDKLMELLAQLFPFALRVCLSIAVNIK